MSFTNLSQILFRHTFSCIKNFKSLKPICVVEPCSQFTVPVRNLEKQTSVPLTYSREFRFEETPKVPEDFRYVYRDFLPPPNIDMRHRLKEKIEREDMLCRRQVIDIPEFYVGSIMAVTVSDQNASGKLNRFVGICIQRDLTGLYSKFILRNVVDNIGVEISYEMYCPLIQSIEVLRLEKRLDDKLLYLRDCLPEYSTFPFDMEPEQLPEGAPVPVNTIKAVFKPRPWKRRWERHNYKGVERPRIPYKLWVQKERVEKPWEKYDLMLEYRSTIPEEEQALIYKELTPHLPKLEAARRRIRRAKLFK
ncbi:UNVERIFIED_CONTAM: hypothetical protein RMT77_010254 [Armadillidium vulgare]